MNDMPSLTGTERLRIEQHNRDCAAFTWANSKVERLIAQCRWREANNLDNAMNEQLETWEPSNGPH
jgi:hypothetical protein